MFSSVPTQRRAKEGKFTEAALGQEWESDDRPLGIAGITVVAMCWSLGSLSCPFMFLGTLSLPTATCS